MKKRVISFLKLILSIVITIGIGFVASKFMTNESLSKIGIDISYQYLIFTIILSFIMVASRCFSFKLVSSITLFLSVITTLIIVFHPSTNQLHYWYFFPISINLVGLSFYFFWVNPLITKMKGLQFAILAAIIYAIIIVVTYKILKMDIALADFSLFLMNSLAMFIAISVGLAISSLIGQYVDIQLSDNYIEVDEEKEDEDFEEI
ncbi:MAG: hypothetical protein U9N34_07225 [Candidatus Cloacimonadota bacterium]|nr:hypothetical protein [Candidatus Cloacimonadota bacterium]